MNQKELVDAVVGRLSFVITKREVKDIVETVARVIGEAVEDGHEISFFHLGKFTSVCRAARTGRNPLTGAKVEIPAKRALVFKASAKMKNI